jgi:osmotically-inducible protein OsmY
MMRTDAIKSAKPELLDDDELQRVITERIDEDPVFWIGAARSKTVINVEVDNGYVTLTGTVRTAIDRRRADILARALGASGVDNRLQVTSASPGPKPRRVA